MEKGLIKIWEKEVCEHIDRYDKCNLTSQLINFARLMIPGRFYIFVVNFYDLNFDYVSSEVKNILGIRSDRFTIQTLVDQQSKAGKKLFKIKESFTIDFLFNFLSPEEIPDYKVVYFLDMEDKSGNQVTILHQVTTLKLSQSGKVEHTMCVHTDVSHLKLGMRNNVSFIHLKGGKSYVNMDPSYENFEKALAAKKATTKIRLTKRELDIVGLVAKGFTTDEISKKVNITKNTVNTLKRNMMKKNNVKNITQLVSECILENVIEL